MEILKLVKLCPKCRNYNSNNAKFCEYCGNSIEKIECTHSNVNNQRPEVNNESLGWFGKQNNGMKAVLGIAVVIVLIVCIGVIWTASTGGLSVGQNSSNLSGNLTVNGPDSYGIYKVTGTIMPNKDFSYLQMELIWYDSNGTIIQQNPLTWNINNVESGKTYQVTGQSDLYQKETPTKVNVIFYDSIGTGPSTAIYNSTINL